MPAAIVETRLIKQRGGQQVLAVSIFSLLRARAIEGLPRLSKEVDSTFSRQHSLRAGSANHPLQGQPVEASEDGRASRLWHRLDAVQELGIVMRARWQPVEHL